MDRLDPARRSANMAKVRGKNTGPELLVRRIAHAMGLRFRLHRSDLPGSPDLVLPRHKLVVFVHGCFWHRHEGCRRASVPATRQEFWDGKFAATVERDRRNLTVLEQSGWKVLTLWECELKDASAVEEAFRAALKR